MYVRSTPSSMCLNGLYPGGITNEDFCAKTFMHWYYTSWRYKDQHQDFCAKTYRYRFNLCGNCCEIVSFFVSLKFNEVIETST
jgi:hypothetical protein